MPLLVYLIAYPFIFILSRLPLRVSYILSNIISVFLHHVIHYRRPIIRTNLEIAFPEKTKKERKAIERKFYRHFSDIFFEMLHVLHTSKSEQLKRVKLTNPEFLDAYKDRSVLYLSGHYCNWEWLSVLSYYTQAHSFAVYTKVQNRYFEKHIKKMRQRCGANLFERSEAVKVVLSNHQKKRQAHYAFVSDQSPMLHLKRNYWRTFFNKPVPCFTGYDFLARNINLVVVFVNMKKIKRGYYQCTLELITDDAKNEKKHFIIDKFYETLESQIKSEPSYYLWTHNRWKHSPHAKEFMKSSSYEV